MGEAGLACIQKTLAVITETLRCGGAFCIPEYLKKEHNPIEKKTIKKPVPGI